MHSYRLNRFAIYMLVMMLSLSLIVPSVSADCAGNVLSNGGFEGSFSDRADGQIYVADGWGYFYQNGPFSEDGLNVRPTFGQEKNSSRIREGATSQAFGMTYSTHNAGIYQQVQVSSGSQVTLSAWALAWSSTGDDSNVSTGGQYYLSVGIDPTGGTDWSASSVVWSAENITLDSWVNLTLSAQAQNSTITVFLRGRAEWKIKYNYSYWDDICVTYTAPTPMPTNTPAPTAIPTATTIPTETPLPTATATAEPTATPVPGSISVTVFDDLNENGIMDDDEATISGAAVEITDSDDVVVDSYDAAEINLTEGLSVGTYTVSKINPDGYTSVTPNEAIVSVISGETAEVSFAVKAIPTVEPTAKPTEADAEATPEPTATETSSSDSGGGIGGWTGIIVVIVAIALFVLSRIFFKKPVE